MAAKQLISISARAPAADLRPPQAKRLLKKHQTIVGAFGELRVARPGASSDGRGGARVFRRDARRDARVRDAQLEADTAKAVAAFEMIHVRNLHTKIQEANDWRGSAWWLAQRFPKR
jgi:hypothetical protein